MARLGALPLLLMAALYGASAHACNVPPTETVRIESVSDTVTYTLTDGRVLRLEGLGPPRAPADHTGPWILGEVSTSDVSEDLPGMALSIAPTDAPDRYGRLAVQAFTEEGRWINGELVAEGLARVETLPGEARCAAEALVLEDEARQARRGMWRLAAYQVLSPEEAAAFTNDFQIVEGEIVSTADVRGRIYLNFGADWRTDFTLTIAPGDARAFARAGLNPLNWAGRRVRARGWLSWYNGPQIEVDHPEQIELLGGDITPGGDEGDGE